MKEWWINLSLREKQTVSLGVVALVIGLLYALIWAPLNQSIATTRDQIEHNQKLLAWMQQADKQIQSAESLGQTPQSRITGSRISIVQTSLKQSAIGNNITQLVQADNDSVKLSFQQVSFDLLISWLTELWQQQGLVVTQMSIKPGTKTGMVTAELIVS